MALESAPADAAKSSSSSTKLRSLILTFTPEQQGGRQWVPYAGKILSNDKHKTHKKGNKLGFLHVKRNINHSIQADILEMKIFRDDRGPQSTWENMKSQHTGLLCWEVTVLVTTLP